MFERDKWLEVISKLIALTQEGQLKWRAQRPDDSLKEEPDDRIRIVFTATYQDHHLRLYKRSRKRTRRQTPGVSSPTLTEAESNLLKVSGVYHVQPREEDEPTWVSDVVLEFVTDDNLPILTAPSMRILSDLLNAVRYQVAGVRDFTNRILSDQAEED
jgi:hypothetical protein